MPIINKAVELRSEYLTILLGSKFYLFILSIQNLFLTGVVF